MPNINEGVRYWPLEWSGRIAQAYPALRLLMHVRIGSAHRAVDPGCAGQRSPDELPDFEAEFGIALAEVDETFDLGAVNQVLNRWWGRAHLRLNPPTAEERL